MWKLSKSKTLIVDRKRLSAKGARHSFRRKISEGGEKAVDSSKPRYETPKCGDHWPESKRTREKATDLLSSPTTKQMEWMRHCAFVKSGPMNEIKLWWRNG